MFDTVRLGVQGVQLDLAKLQGRGWQKVSTQKIDGEGVAQESTWLTLVRAGQSPQFLMYLPKSEALKLETSLPKLVHGQNVSLLSPAEMGTALDELSNRVSDLIGSEIPHCGEWDIRGRLDAVFAWQVGSRVPDYLHAFKSLNLPRHFQESVDRESTLYWKSNQRLIRMYDKFKESGLEAAKGLLRFEVQENHAKAELKRLTGAESVRACDVLDWDHACRILQHYLDGLGADLIISDREKVVRTLLERCTPAKARALFGTVEMLQLFSRSELVGMQKGQGHSVRQRLWSDLRSLKELGIGAGYSKSGLLPPLTLPKTYTGSPIRSGS